MSTLTIFRDNSVPLLHTATLDIGGCLWNTASFSWHVPQGAGPVSLQAHISSVPGSARFPGLTMFYVPSLPKSSPDPWAKSFQKWDFSLYYQTGVRTRTPRSEECGKGRRGWPPVCEKPPLPIIKPLQDLEKPLRVCFNLLGETPKPWFWKGFKHSPDELSFHL